MHRGGGGRTMHIAQRPGLPEKWCRRDAQCGRTPAGSPTLLSHKQSSLHSPPLTTSSIFLTAAGPSAVDHLFFVPQKDLSWSIKCTRLSQSKNTRTFPIDGCRRFVIVFSGLLIRLTQENVASGVSSHCWRAFSIRVHKGGTIPPKETHLRAHGSKDRTFRLWVWSQIAEMFFLPEMTAWKKKEKKVSAESEKDWQRFSCEIWEGKHPNFHRLDKSLLAASSKKREGSSAESWWSCTWRCSCSWFASWGKCYQELSWLFHVDLDVVFSDESVEVERPIKCGQSAIILAPD